MRSQIRLAVCGVFFLLPHVLHGQSAEGYVIQWGWNTALAKPVPAKLILSNAVDVAAGSGHSLALRGDGTVFGWGGNIAGEAIGVPTTAAPYVSADPVRPGGEILSNIVSIVAARGFSLALKKDGTVVSWGRNHVPGGVTNMMGIAAGWSTSWALRRDGTVVGWHAEQSEQTYGRLLPVEGLSNVVAIAVGAGGHGWRGVALKRDGTVGHWGVESIYKDATPPPGLSNVVGIAAGANHSLALKADGSVVGWGANTFGQATGTATTNSADGSISHGEVRINGQVLSDAISVAAGNGYSMALKKNGNVVIWGQMGPYSTFVPEGLSNVVAIAAGAEDFCLAITTNAAVAARFTHSH